MQPVSRQERRARLGALAAVPRVHTLQHDESAALRTSAERKCTLASPVGLPCALMPRWTLPSLTVTPTEWKNETMSLADALNGSPRILRTWSSAEEGGCELLPAAAERASAARPSRPPSAVAARGEALAEGGELPALFPPAACAPLLAPREVAGGCGVPTPFPPLPVARALEPPAAADARALAAAGASAAAPRAMSGLDGRPAEPALRDGGVSGGEVGWKAKTSMYRPPMNWRSCGSRGESRAQAQPAGQESCAVRGLRAHAKGAVAWPGAARVSLTFLSARCAACAHANCTVASPLGRPCAFMRMLRQAAHRTERRVVARV